MSANLGSDHSLTPSQHRVLVVEDNPGDAKLIECLLAPQGRFSLDHVTTLAGTRTRLLRQRYDAVLLDLTLPDGEQAETLREIARFAEHIPIVALTGVEDDELAKRCLATGIQDYVYKSELSDTALVRSLNHAISRHRAAELQRRIESAQRQISLGRVAGSVVHEINNMATVVLSGLEGLHARIEACESDPPADVSAFVGELRELLEQEISAVAKMNVMSDDLRLFAQREARSAASLDVNSVVSSTLRLLDSRLRLRAEVESVLGSVPEVFADESKLSQVLINLLLNAVDALDDVPDGRRRIRIETRMDRQWVAVVVSDTGMGIREEDIDRVFEPFFSSKPVGRGSGLGLSICSELVASWDGVLAVESEPGRGSNFIVKLPVAPREHRKRSSILPRAKRRVLTSARVLLIDDMDEPRRAIRRMMEREHVVEEAASGEAALEMLRGGAQFDVVLCDLMMPEMDGVELYRRAIELCPSLEHRFILLTGGAFMESSQVSLGGFDLPLLGKPIMRAVLLSAIEERLTESPDPSES